MSGQHYGSLEMIIDTVKLTEAGVYPRLHKWGRECFREASVGILTYSVEGNSFEHLEQKNERT